MKMEIRGVESELVYCEETMARQGKEDLVRWRTISTCILQSYLAWSWIQEYKGSVLISELLYSQGRACVHLLGWEAGVMGWMVYDR